MNTCQSNSKDLKKIRGQHVLNNEIVRKKDKNNSMWAEAPQPLESKDGSTVHLESEHKST